MSAAWTWPGSRWWRVDLHTHSPASHDFKGGNASKQPDWAAWVEAAKQAQLDAAALTDHNTPNGILEIKAAAAASGGLIVFPGVEVTVGGVHLLCVFDPKSDRDEVTQLLADLGIRATQFGNEDATSNKSVVEAIEIAAAAGAVVVGAHVNGPKGLVQALEGQERIKALRCPDLSAAELVFVPPNKQGNPEWLDPRAVNVQRWLDGSQPDLPRVTQVWSSDSHSERELGRHYTWIKMTRPDLDGVRLALLDGEGSVRPSMDAGDPNDHAGNLIESITVGSAKYIGQPSPLTIGFNPWLNAIIGSRGTGKSTLIDLLRVALRREGELGSSNVTTLRKAFDDRMQIPANRAAEGLLCAETNVEVVYRKDGERFVLAWDRQGLRPAITRIEGDERKAEAGDIRERFPIRIYSQKQLFELARDPNALLDVIDDSDEVGGAELDRALQALAEKYLALRAEFRSLRARAADLPQREAALADVRRKLEILQQGGHAVALQTFRSRSQQDGTWESIRSAVAARIEAVGNAAEELTVADLDFGKETTLEGPLHALERVHAELRDVVAAARATILETIAATQARITSFQSGADLSKWRAAVAESERAYHAVTTKLAEAGIGNPEEFRVLLQRSAALEREIAGLRNRQAVAAIREQEAEDTLRRCRQLRVEWTVRRATFAGSQTTSGIKVAISSFSGRTDLGEYVRDALSIERFDSDCEQIVAEINGADGAAWSFDRLDNVVARLREFLADPTAQLPTKDRRFAVALRKLQPERLDRLALYLPADEVEINFRDPRQKDADWRNLVQGSPGQQTAALLTFVLGYGTEPIVLDQPEDDLDNSLITELVVRRLKETKASRQVIVVTHNPNIVVHGDAELIVSLTSHAGQTAVAFQGGLQEQGARDEICKVMEGGTKAFADRYRRIMPRGRCRDG